MSWFAWQRELVDLQKQQICKRACRSAVFDKRWIFCKPLFKADLQVRHRAQRHITGELKSEEADCTDPLQHTDSHEHGHASIDHSHPGLISQDLCVWILLAIWWVSGSVSMGLKVFHVFWPVQSHQVSVLCPPRPSFGSVDRAILLWYLSGWSNVGLARPVVRPSWLNTRWTELLYREVWLISTHRLVPLLVLFLLWTFGRERDTFHKTTALLLWFIHGSKHLLVPWTSVLHPCLLN